MQTEDIVIKQTEPLRVAEAHAVAAGLADEHIGPIFMRLAPMLIGHIKSAGAEPGLLVGYYDDPAEDGSVGVHVAFEIGDQPVPAGDGVTIADLPVIEVATFVHRGGMAEIGSVYESLMGWIADSGYQVAGYSRELYLEMTDAGPSVTELQVPITR